MVEEGALVVFGELGGFGDAGFEEVGGGVEGSAGLVVEDEVVEAGVEGFGDAGVGVEGCSVVFGAAGVALPCAGAGDADEVCDLRPGEVAVAGVCDGAGR